MPNYWSNSSDTTHTFTYDTSYSGSTTGYTTRNFYLNPRTEWETNVRIARGALRFLKKWAADPNAEYPTGTVSKTILDVATRMLDPNTRISRNFIKFVQQILFHDLSEFTGSKIAKYGLTNTVRGATVLACWFRIANFTTTKAQVIQEFKGNILDALGKAKQIALRHTKPYHRNSYFFRFGMEKLCGTPTFDAARTWARLADGQSAYQVVNEAVHPIKLTRKECAIITKDRFPGGDNCFNTLTDLLLYILLMRYRKEANLTNCTWSATSLMNLRATIDLLHHMSTIRRFFQQGHVELLPRVLQIVKWSALNAPDYITAHERDAVDFLNRQLGEHGRTELLNLSMTQLIELHRTEIRNQRLKNAPNIDYPHCPIPSVGFVSEKKRYVVEHVGKRHDLFYEGQELSHCVYTYENRVLSGDTAIYSLRTEQGKRLVTMELVMDRSKPTIIQARGKRNRLPTEEEQTAITHFAELFGLKTAC